MCFLPSFRVVFALLGLLVPLARAAPGDLDLSFNPGGVGDFEDGQVGAMARQPDGKLLVAGDFTQFRGEDRVRIARLDVDGTVDPGFNADGTGPDGLVHQIRVLPDGKILISGEFTTVDGVAKTRMARLDGAGNVDPAFTGNFDGFIRDIELVSGDRILVCGDFEEVNGVLRHRMALLSSSGFPDFSFNSPIATGGNSFVNEMALQADGKIVAGGRFGVANNPRSDLVRIEVDGDVDPSFAAVDIGNETIYSVALDSAGNVLIAGTFEEVNGAARGGVARLDPGGGLDAGFFDGEGGSSFSLKTVRATADGKVIVTGGSTFSGVALPGRFIQLNGDGSVDEDFVASDPRFQDDAQVLGDSGLLLVSNESAGGELIRSLLVLRPLDGGAEASYPSPNTFLPGIEGGIGSIVVQDDGKVLVAGFFGRIQAKPISMIARFHPDGRVEESFSPFSDSSDPRGYDIAVQGDGRILFAGRWGSTVRRNLTRFGADGSAMAGFSTVFGNFGGLLNEVLVQPDGRILVAGIFPDINGIERGNIGRLLYDGSTDTSFLDGLAGVDQAVGVMALQPDGKVLIGGGFTSVNGVARPNLARLEPDGSLDEGFLGGLAGPDGSVGSIEIDREGKIVIGGSFENINGSPRPHFARLEPDGSLDPGFASGVGGTDGFVNALALKSDGRVVIGGPFTEVDGMARGQIAQLNEDGSVDPVFMASQQGITDSGNSIGALAIDADGNVLVGGGFARINGVEIHALARLEGDGSGGLRAPRIAVQPVAVEADPGDEVVLSVEVADPGSFRYQWFRDGKPLVDGFGTEGSTTAVLRLSDVDRGSATGDYSVVVTGGGGMVASDTAIVSFPRTPFPRNDLAERDQGQPVLVPIADLLANDSNPVAGALVLAEVVASSFGIAYTEGDQVRYEPDPFFPMPVTGTFDYTVRNALGVTATATVTVLVRDPDNDVPGTIAGATVLEGGELQLGFVGTPGKNYVIQTADQLVQPNWITLATVAADAQGRIVFSPPGGLQDRAFFLVHPVF